MSSKSNYLVILIATLSILLVSLACGYDISFTPIMDSNSTPDDSNKPDYSATIVAGIAQTQTAFVPTPDIYATISAGVAGTQTALSTTNISPTLILSPTATPDMSALNGDINLAVGKPVIARAGGVNYEPWVHANDAIDFNTTTKPGGGRWGIETNRAGGAYQIIDLGKEYEITGIGYSLDWDGAFKNPLKFVVQISKDTDTWTTVSDITHPYDGVNGSNWVNIKIPIEPIKARYIKFWEPPDEAWNGWGDFFELRVYGKAK